MSIHRDPFELYGEIITVVIYAATFIALAWMVHYQFQKNEAPPPESKKVNSQGHDLFESALDEKLVVDNEDEKIFAVERAGKLGNALANRTEVEDFLCACGIQSSSQQWEAAMAGTPIHIDGANIRFIRQN